jgi:Uma2 family endonuclease
MVALRRPADRPRMPLDGFAAFEASRPAGEKWELLFGKLYLMAGGTPRHSQICANIIISLGQQLRRGPCIVYTSDAKVVRAANDLGVYPDVTIRCGDPTALGAAIEDPRVLFEVSSPSSENTDAGIKLEAYTLIPGLEAYVIVRQDEWRIEVWRREGEEWDKSVLKHADDILRLDGIEAALPLADIYERTGLAP